MSVASTLIKWLDEVKGVKSQVPTQARSNKGFSGPPAQGQEGYFNATGGFLPSINNESGVLGRLNLPRGRDPTINTDPANAYFDKSGFRNPTIDEISPLSEQITREQIYKQLESMGVPANIGYNLPLEDLMQIMKRFAPKE